MLMLRADATRLPSIVRTCRLGLVAVLIDQDSDFFDFLMRLWLRGIQVEQVFKKLGDDGCAPAALCCCCCCCCCCRPGLLQCGTRSCQLRAAGPGAAG